MLHGINQSQKDKYCMILLILGIASSQIHRNRKYNGDCQGLGESGKEELFSMNIEFQICKMKSSGDLFYNCKHL